MTKAALFEWCEHRFGDRFSTGSSVRDLHGRDQSGHFPVTPPDAVLWAETKDEVIEIVRRCGAARCPIIPYGAGSSVEGHILAVNGGVSLDLSRMNAVKAVHQADMVAEVEAGVTRMQLNDYLRDTGLVFPADPGADATLGGMAATRASGTTAVRYGTMRDLVVSIEAVLADGSLIRTGSRARKSSAGYDMTRLMVGSEGTLGVITGLEVRLYPRPEASETTHLVFPAVSNAVEFAINVMASGVTPARIELLDATQMTALMAYHKINLPAGPSIFLEIAGTPGQVSEQSEMVLAYAEDHGAAHINQCATAEEASQVWKIRYSAVAASRGSQPGCETLSTDLCVPISTLAEAVERSQRMIDAAGLEAHFSGHVGDGNFHAMFICDPNKPHQMAKANVIHGEMVVLALEFGGTATGEHGVGLGKKRYMAAEHGANLAAMRAIKTALDPQNLMNPGKIFDFEAQI
ncbi:MAG: FAD-linked oxidase C-terminal domain-containing protein [Alphaproteobacteria bacterium]|nr:FAD-linked oxidase C-terminal domain-containing protein [Alphaproteobacteria bacterium]